MKHAASRDLHAYWNTLRAGRTAPERVEIDPAAIRHVLAYTFILEVTETVLPRARDVRFRLSGTRLDALFGQDLRGRSFDRLWNRGDAGMADALLDVVLQDRAAVVASTHGGPPGCGGIALELLLLPLRHHGRTQARILGSLAAAEVPGWMGLAGAGPLDLLGFRSLAPDADPGQPTAAASAAHRGARPTPISLAERGMAASRVPVQVGRFRVYEGGEGRRGSAGAGP